MTIEPDAWLLDDREIPLDGYHATFDTKGCLRAGGRVSAEVAYRAEQGAPLTAVLNDDTVWDGEISRPPHIYRGQADLEAQGHQKNAQKATDPLLYQTMAVGLWTPAGGDPHNYPLSEGKYEVQVRGGDVIFHANPVAILNGEGQAICLWVPESPGGITRVAYSWIQQQVSNNNLLIQRGTGPSGGVTTSHTQGLGGATFGSVDHPITAPEDMVRLAIAANANHTPPDLYVQVFDLRVNGIAPGDEFFTSDVVKDAGRRLGCDVSKAQASTVDALPFFFQGGSWLDGVFVYMARLADWAPPFFGPDRGSGCELRFGPWGDQVFPVSLEKDARPDLVSLELYNRVAVTFPHVGGFNRTITILPEDIDEPDPLATYGIVNSLPMSLRDPQPDETLARAMGEAALRRRIRPCQQGRLEVASVPGGTPWSLLPGYHTEIAWEPMETMELPIHSLEFSQGQLPRVGIEAPATEVGLEDIAALEAQRHQVPETAPWLVPSEQQPTTGPTGPTF